MPAFKLTGGRIPLLVSIPHNSSRIPTDLANRMTDVGRSSTDTDWFLDRLYNFASELGAGRILPEFSRYVIDLNRAQSDESLYPGQTTTGLFPHESFDGEPLFVKSRGEGDTTRFVESHWKPYHTAIQDELARLHDKFGKAVLFEAHSIASRVPRLFDGKLQDFNFGTNHGATCDESLSVCLLQTISQANQYSHVFNGRFVGGYITRAYGDPGNNVHAVQLELSQATYLDEETKAWSDQKARQVQPMLHNLIESIVQWCDA